MKTRLSTGHTFINITLPDEKVLDILMGKDIPGISNDAVKQIISRGVKENAPGRIDQKKIAIVIPDNTRRWARGDLFVPRIVKTLLELGVSRKNICIIIALGTHGDIKEDEFPLLAGDYCSRNIKILNSANKDLSRLIRIGQTQKKTDLLITKEAAEADHIIIFGGILHHMLAGFGGGRKYILPGIAGYDSVQQNHSLAIKNDGTAHPLVRQAKLKGNPVNEDMNDAADLFLKDKTCTYIAVAANGTGDIFYADAGPLHSTFLKGCDALDQACSVEVPEKGDFALISAGGYKTDEQLYQATKALFNSVNVVKEGGQILFVAGCSNGAGNRIFGSALSVGKDNRLLGKELAEQFNMPLYVAFRAMDILKRFRVILVSEFEKKETEMLGFGFTDRVDDWVKNVEGKGYIIPFAENILPSLK